MSMRLFGTALVVVCSSSGLAQDAAAPDARAILRECAKALSTAKALTYKAEIKTEGESPFAYPPSSGMVTIARAEGEPGFLVKVKGALAAPPDVEFTNAEASNDGTTVRLVDHAAKTFSTVELDDMTWTIMPGINLLIMEYAFPEHVHLDGDQIADAKVIGEVEIAGVACHVVEVTVKPPEGSDFPPTAVRRAISKRDHIVRRVEWPLEDGLEEGMPRVVMTYSEVRISTETPSKASFALAKPEGYADLEMPGLEGLPRPKFKVGTEAADFALKDAEGKEVKLSELRGKIVLLDFWATWCGPCRSAMPGLQKLHEKYKDKGLVVLGINIFDNSDPIEFMTANKYTYTTLLEGDDVARLYGIEPIPQFYLIGPDGLVLHHAIGFDPKHDERLEKLIEENLDKVKR